MRLALLCFVLAVGCGPAAVDPRVIEHAANGVVIRREVLVVPGPTPPPNPVTQGATPASTPGMQVVRYRVDTGSAAPKPARAILLLMPGFLGGAGSFDSLARAIVRRSTADAPLEAWALDRRANLLEDRTGIEAALAQQNADVLTGYYFAGAAVNGTTFAGFQTQQQVDFESEWGMATTIDDLRAVIALIPAEQRQARVVLAGHSLGASIVSQYAAWDFAGAAGHDELAGLVLIDGVTGSEGGPLALTQAQYETDGQMTTTMGTVPSVKAIREGSRYFAFPILEAKLFPVGVGTALRATLHPDLVEADTPRNTALQTLFLMDRLPRFTNRAAFGLAFDAASCPVSIAAVNAGASTGGALTSAPSPFGGGTVVKPSEVTATYAWQEYDQVNPREFTSLTDFALAWTRPDSDFGEWYFPLRLTLDSAVGASLVLDPAAWPVTAWNLRAIHGRELSMPVLVEAAGILQGDVTAYDALKAILPPVGAGRPQAGAARTSSDGFQTHANPAFSHIDPLAATDDAGSAAAEWFDTLASFLRRVTPEGGVSVKAFGR